MNDELLSCLANGLIEDRIRSTDAETTVENIAVITVVLFTYVDHSRRIYTASIWPLGLRYSTIG